MDLTVVWDAAQKAGPFSSLILLIACWTLYRERVAAIKKYDDLVNRFIILATDSTATMKDWQRVLADHK
jgi:hypothetical protein